jgi:hypothetical protein
MAKRTRYESRSSGRRPAANRLARRDPPKAKPIVADPTPPSVAELEATDELGLGAPATARGAHLTQAEIDRAAALEADLAAHDPALGDGRRPLAGLRRTRTDEAPVRAHGHADVNAPLAVRASKEYAYVARDIRRIALTGGLMIAILAVIDVLVNVLGVIKL